MKNNLVQGLDRELRDTYGRFVQILPAMASNTTNEATTDDYGDLIISRYQFANYAIQSEQLPFFTREQLTDDLSHAKTQKSQKDLLYLIGLQQKETRETLGISSKSPIQLSATEFNNLVQSPDGQIIVNHEVQESFKTKPTLMRLLVQIDQLQWKPTALNPSNQDRILSIIYVGRSLEDINDTLAKLQSVIFLLFFAGLLTAGTGAYLLAGEALQPLRKVQRAAERIGGKNLTERVPVPATGDEVQSLAQALNAMLNRLEASFDAQRRFTSDASHELRTPVTAISGHASYLLRRTQPNAQQEESLLIIRNESERLTNLIASLLQLARSDSGALILSKQLILSYFFLTELARELMPLAQAQQTTLTVTGPDIPFEGDPDRLKQVLINLISNALKAGAKTITLESELVEKSIEKSIEKSKFLRLLVKDDGPGIPNDQLERLFDRFYRLEDSRSRDQGGAGLGLSIARGIVEAHGGKIWLSSTLGVGTTAYVQLPIGDIPELDDDDLP